MIAQVEIIMDCPVSMVGHHQLEEYLKKKLKARDVTVKSWKSGFQD